MNWSGLYDFVAPFGLIPLLIVIAFGPGFFFVRRFRWTPLETMAASVGLSLTLLFLGVFAIFVTGATLRVHAALTAGALMLTVAAWDDVVRLWRRRIVRHTAYALLGLIAWTLLLLTLVRQYGGGDTCCDWVEHYERTRHFLTPWPVDYLYLGIYQFPARPPLMNAAAAHILWWTGASFPAFQVVFSILNVIGLLGCCVVSAVVSKNGRPADPRLLAILLGANPMFFMNTTFPWTKVLTAFFVLLGLALYVAGWKRQDKRRVTAALLALAAAALTHYSAVPVALLIGVHYLAVVALPARWMRWTDTVRAAALAIALVSPWIGYVAVTYGVSGGLLRNPSFEGTVEASLADHVETRARNLVDTFIPRKYDGYNDYPEDATPVRWWSDQIFTIYQSNAIFSIGSVSGLLAGLLAVQALARLRSPRERRFWLAFIPAVWIFGVVVHGDRNDTGLAMISLQPVTYLAIAFLATRLPGLTRTRRRVWYAGAVTDLTLGIGLAVWFEMASGPWAFTPNWRLKEHHALAFLGDHRLPVILIAAVAIAAALAGLIAARRMILRRAAGVRRLLVS